GPGAGESPKLVAVAVVVSKRAKFKKMPHPIMLEFQARAARDISREQRKHYMRPRLEAFEQLEHARKEFAFPARQFQRQEMHVAVQERADVFVSRGNLVLFQNAQGDSRIGHA